MFIYDLFHGECGHCLKTAKCKIARPIIRTLDIRILFMIIECITL